MQPRAIETRYKGYRFRSRLEARWAVFFDALGLRWEYEPEGFELPGGVRYLPDFYVGTYVPGHHGYGPWVEIKAVEPTPKEINLMGALCEKGTTYGLIVWGTPGDEGFVHFHKEGHIDDDSRDGFTCYNHWSAYLFSCSEVGNTRVQKAIEAARGARFEHGESGAKR